MTISGVYLNIPSRIPSEGAPLPPETRLIKIIISKTYELSFVFRILLNTIGN